MAVRVTLHCRHIIAKPPLHLGAITITSTVPHRHTTITPPSHHSHTTVTPPLHRRHTTVTPPSHHRHTTVTPEPQRLPEQQAKRIN